MEFIKLHPQFDKSVDNSKISLALGNGRSTYRDSYTKIGALRSLSQYGAVADRVVDSCWRLEYPPIRNSVGEVNHSLNRAFANSADHSIDQPKRVSENCIGGKTSAPCILTDFGNEYYRCDMSHVIPKSPVELDESYDVRRKLLEMRNPGYVWQVPNMSTGQPKRYTNFTIN